MDPLDEIPRIAISVERTINLGNYESAKVFLAVSNLTAYSTPEEVAKAIDFQGSVFEDLKAQVIELTKTTRAEHTAQRQVVRNG